MRPLSVDRPTPRALPSRGDFRWGAIPDTLGGSRAGERRLLMIAASIGGGTRINLADVISGLDRRVLDLVLAAISHLAGSHEHSEYMPTIQADGSRTIDPASPRLDLDAIHPWPAG